MIEKETEIKFRVDESFADRLKNIKLNSFCEEDEYFTTKEMLENSTFLRFRKKQGKIFLIMKDITHSAEIYEADEINMQLTEEQYEKLKNIFQAIFPHSFIVSKTRSVGSLNGCEIYLDKVDRLGTFLEIEGPKENIIQACEQLGLDVRNSDREKGYAHMMAKESGIDYKI